MASVEGPCETRGQKQRGAREVRAALASHFQSLTVEEYSTLAAIWQMGESTEKLCESVKLDKETLDYFIGATESFYARLSALFEIIDSIPNKIEQQKAFAALLSAIRGALRIGLTTGLAAKKAGAMLQSFEALARGLEAKRSTSQAIGDAVARLARPLLPKPKWSDLRIAREIQKPLKAQGIRLTVTAISKRVKECRAQDRGR